MKAPDFWYQKPGFWSALLSPLSALWRLGAERRARRPGAVDIGIPVICVGNLTVGGTGKTPTVIALIERLTADGWTPHVVSRGYGGRMVEPTQVAPHHSASDVGDEPLMLSSFAPVWVGQSRVATAKAAGAAGADCIVLDDGFQDPSLRKTLSLLVIDAQTRFGNDRLLPSGPLREPVASGLSRADLCLLIGSEADISNAQSALPEVMKYPVAMASIVPLETGMDWDGLRAIAFAGIGHPSKFFETLRALKVDLIATHGFGDHEPYSDLILQRLDREAIAARARLVTTEKDAMRLPPAWRQKVFFLPVRLRFSNDTALETALTQIKDQFSTRTSSIG